LLNVRFAPIPAELDFGRRLPSTAAGLSDAPSIHIFVLKC
jgi:hypothetical protein